MSDESTIFDYTVPIVCDPIIVIVSNSTDEPIIIVCDPITKIGATGDNGTGVTGDNGTGPTGDNGTGVTGDNGTGPTGDNGTGVTGDNGTGVTGDNGTGVTGDNGTGVTGKTVTWGTDENGTEYMSNNNNEFDTSLPQFDILIKKPFKILSVDTNIILTSPNSVLFSVIFMCNYGISIMKHISISGIYHSNWIKNNNSIYKYIEDNISNILNS